MNNQTVLFGVFAACTLLAGLRVITARNPVHAVLFLVLAFVGSAGLWLLLEAEFLGIVLVLVYVGAVMVLFLFVVMMLDIHVATLRSGMARYAPIGILVALVMLGEIGYVVWSRKLGVTFGAPLEHAADYSNTRELGDLIYTVYAYPFEIAAPLPVILQNMRLHDRIDRTAFFTESAEDALGQIDVVARGTACSIVALFGFDRDRQCRANSFAQLACNTALLAIRVAPQSV